MTSVEPAGSKLPTPFRDRDLDPVPVEGESSGGAAFIQSRGIYDFPLGVVEAGSACMRCEVVGFIRAITWLAIRACGFEIDLDDLRVAIAPCAFDKLRAFFSGEIDRRLRFALGEHFIERGAGDEFCRQHQKSGDTCYKKDSFVFHDCTLSQLI